MRALFLIAFLILFPAAIVAPCNSPTEIVRVIEAREHVGITGPTGINGPSGPASNNCKPAKVARVDQICETQLCASRLYCDSG